MNYNSISNANKESKKNNVPLQNSINFDNSEEFGLSVTKIDNNVNSHDNKPVNGSQNNKSNGVAKRKTGQIIDFRAMINEATKITFSGNGNGGGENNNDNNDSSDKLMKPLAGYIGYNSEWRELAQVISRVCNFK